MCVPQAPHFMMRLTFLAATAATAAAHGVAGNMPPINPALGVPGLSLAAEQASAACSPRVQPPCS